MRRPIAEFDPEVIIEPTLVGDEFGNVAHAALDPDQDGSWVDLTDPERPVELRFVPTWFQIVYANTKVEESRPGRLNTSDWRRDSATMIAVISLAISLASAGFSYLQLEEMRASRITPMTSALFEKRLDNLVRLIETYEQTMVAEGMHQRTIVSLKLCPQTGAFCDGKSLAEWEGDEKKYLSEYVDRVLDARLAMQETAMLWDDEVFNEYKKAESGLHRYFNCSSFDSNCKQDSGSHVLRKFIYRIRARMHLEQIDRGENPLDQTQ